MGLEALHVHGQSAGTRDRARSVARLGLDTKVLGMGREAESP
jgi:hypothetical protein